MYLYYQHITIFEKYRYIRYTHMSCSWLYEISENRPMCTNVWLVVSRLSQYKHEILPRLHQQWYLNLSLYCYIAMQYLRPGYGNPTRHSIKLTDSLSYPLMRSVTFNEVWVGHRNAGRPSFRLSVRLVTRYLKNRLTNRLEIWNMISGHRKYERYIDTGPSA